MRGIKFRGHDGIEWRYSETVLNDTDYLNGNKSEIRFMCIGEVEDWDDGWVSVCHVGQYTGLKDKNGKEIYEGDIVKYNYNNQVYQDVYATVEYSIAGFRLNADYISHHLSRHIGIANTDYYEVVGNIYENPELLTV